MPSPPIDPQFQTHRPPNPHRPLSNLQTNRHRHHLPNSLPSPPQNPHALQRPHPTNLDRPQRRPRPPLRTPVAEGSPMSSLALAEVIESGSPGKLAEGSLVLAPTKWTEYSIHEIKGLQAIKPIEGLDLGQLLGAFGLTGLTGYYGNKVVAGAKAEDTIVVSGAAGSMVVQIAKKIIGLIGIAGTDEKCRWVEKPGADICISYKKNSSEQDLNRETEGFVAEQISNYNRPDTVGLKNFFEVVSMRLHIHGFIVLDYIHKCSEVVAELTQAWKEGKIVVDDPMQTVVEAKFEDVPNLWMKLFEGGNTGKLVRRLFRDWF
ncbi:hypothetical protein BDV12DRAFT_201568 [Aspergillus spectabilis]